MSKQTNKEEIREWEEEFNEKFGKAGPEMNCDSIGRPAGCDDCVVNIKLREEYKNFIKNVEDQAKANLKAKVMAEEMENLELILDKDSCECDNCHRIRRYLKNPKKELHRVNQQINSRK
jgi:nitrate/TMAO reductase-like tetraheme cytochrome c subunit